MNRSPLVALVTLAVLAGVAGAQTTAPQAEAGATPAPRVVATYFHGDVRCPTCRKLEADARTAIEQAFPAELARGRLAFRAVNVDRPENAHFNEDYKLVTRSLVLTEEVDGKVVRWTNLEKIWQLVRDEPAYRDYVVGNVRGYLEGRK